MGRVGMTCLLGQAWNRAEAQSCLKGKKVPCTTAEKKKFSYISNMKIFSDGCWTNNADKCALDKSNNSSVLSGETQRQFTFG